MELGLFCIFSRSGIPLPHSSHFPRSKEDYQAEFAIRPNNPFPNLLLLILLIILKPVNPFSNFNPVVIILILILLKISNSAKTRQPRIYNSKHQGRGLPG